MTTPTELRINLDRVHFALRSGDRWAVCKRMPDGSSDTLVAWAGGRRSLFHRLEELGIMPSREAEERLSQIPESSGFKDRT